MAYEHEQYDDASSDTESQMSFGYQPTHLKTGNTRLPEYLRFAMDPLSQRICINAITGQRYYCPKTNKPIYNGSLESRQLYGVLDCTAPIGNRDPFKLYYDTPEQYERHRHSKVSKRMKAAWRAKMTQLGYSPYGIGNAHSVTEVVEPGTTIISNGNVKHV